LKAPLYEAQRAFMAVLDRTTLADAARGATWKPVSMVRENSAAKP
jgi:hypothetical protein